MLAILVTYHQQDTPNLVLIKLSQIVINIAQIKSAEAFGSVFKIDS